MMRARVMLIGWLAALGVGVPAMSAGAQSARELVKMTEHVLDTKEAFEEWCEKQQKGRLDQKSLGGVSTTECTWKDYMKRELLAVRTVKTGRADTGSADCIAIHYPLSLYSRVDAELVAKFGSKTRSIVSADGVSSKGWFVVLDGRQGAISNLKKDGNGIVYGCLVKVR